MKTEEFWNYVNSGKIKFSQPQKDIIDKLQKGWKIWIINKHHMSGGQWMWKTPYSSNPQYAGKVYRAFWNILWFIRKYENTISGEWVDLEMPSEFFHK